MIKTKFTWAKGFFAKKEKQFEKAQDFIDKQCVEKMTEFVPVALPIYDSAGALRDSATIDEPGKIIYTANYAEHQYYDELNHEHTGNPNAKRLWFEVMKDKYSEEIRNSAGKIIGKK